MQGPILALIVKPLVCLQYWSENEKQFSLKKSSAIDTVLYIVFFFVIEGQKMYKLISFESPCRGSGNK